MIPGTAIVHDVTQYVAFPAHTRGEIRPSRRDFPCISVEIIASLASPPLNRSGSVRITGALIQ